MSLLWTGLDWSWWIRSLSFLPISTLSSTVGSLRLTHTWCATFTVSDYVWKRNLAFWLLELPTINDLKWCRSTVSSGVLSLYLRLPRTDHGKNLNSCFWAMVWQCSGCSGACEPGWVYATRTAFQQLVSTFWDCGQGPPEMQLSSVCDFSRHTISLCLGALPKGFEKGHAAVENAGMKLSSVSAGESYSFTFNI